MLGRVVRKYYFAFLKYNMENKKKTFQEVALVVIVSIFLIAVFLKTVFF